MNYCRIILAAGLVVGCRATTRRPDVVPLPEAEHAVVGFGVLNRDSSVAWITDSVVAYLVADSIPVVRVHRVDGYLETPWFDAKTFLPTESRPLGQDVVKVRAWVDAAKPGFAQVEIETVYVPAADPSLRARDTEVAVPLVHPINRRVAGSLKRLNDKYGAPEEAKEKTEKTVIGPSRGGPPIPVAPADSVPVKPDTTAVKVKPDTTAVKPPKTDPPSHD